jgi:signal transduction histidine kinase
MADPVWYRSLYWRIALGFVALLATLLVVQGLIFLWISGRMDDLFPNRSPARFAGALAIDAATTIAAQPGADLDAHLNARHSGASRGFAVVLSDGRAIVSRRVPPPPMLARIARSRLFDDPYAERGGRFRGPRSDLGSARGPMERRGPAEGPGPRGLAVEFAYINVGGSVAGIVAVPVEPAPLSMALRDLGPTLAVVAFSLLAAGTAVAALVIFRPARRRLRELQHAARAIGAGEVGVRAPETGGDEVSLLARGFNEMASQLEQRTAALEQSDRTRRQLLADVSHELTTPLAAIRGYVETLEMRDVPLSEDARRRYLRIVHDETERLEHIIGDLLDLARVEGGGGSWREEEVPVGQLLERVRHRHGPALREKGVNLETAQAPGIGAVLADPNRLEQALQNLVANAIRHTPTGRTVRVSADAGAEGVVLAVEDQGPGIAPEHLPRIFDRFYKVDQSRASTEAPSGSGLGLSIVRAIVARHGGKVSAANVAGGGARFEVVLPSMRLVASKS